MPTRLKNFDRGYIPTFLTELVESGLISQVHYRSALPSHPLIILARLEQEPDISQNQLAAITELAPMTVARLVDRLEKLGLVKCCADRKVVVLFAFSFSKVTVIVEISKDRVRPRRFEQRKQPSQQDVNQTGGVPHIEIEGIK